MVAPSVTPFGHMNPSYRTILMDPDTMQMVDYWQELLDLPYANSKLLYIYVHVKGRSLWKLEQSRVPYKVLGGGRRTSE